MSARQQSTHELGAAQRERYRGASRTEKAQLLDEFVAATGYHRKPALRWFREGPPAPRVGPGGRPRRYDAVVIGALREVAAASDGLCGKRLAPFLAEWVPALEAEEALWVDPAVRARLLGRSAASIDRHLRPFCLLRRPSGLSTTKPGSLLKQPVPVHTYTPWDEQRPGFVEIDLVAPCGTTTAGFYRNSLTVPAVATGWTECVGVWGKGQAAGFAALKQARARLPVPLLGIDSDHGSAFLNAHRGRWCAQEQLTCTRSRPYWKHDQAHVEQKNWSLVRRLLGEARSESEAARAALPAVYQQLHRWIHHWQPVRKLVAKERDGAKVRKRYDTAPTPYRRVLAWEGLPADAATRLTAEPASSGPRAGWRQVEAARAELWRHDVRRAERAACG